MTARHPLCDPMPLLSSAFEPGRCRELVESMPEGPARDVASAELLYFTGQALAITHRPRSYICEAAPWGALPHDLRAIALHRTGRFREALAQARAALALEPGNPRLQGNAALLEKLAGDAPEA